ncbi:MAG: glycoside hydrolase family 20 zincin-like fold domain-containing protein, partial [Planctomycetota bacterium]
MVAKKALTISIALTVAVCFAGIAAGEQNGMNLLPTPKSVKVTGGELPLTAQTRIVVQDAKLKPIAEIFSRELMGITTIKFEVVDGGEAKPGDIVLNINPKLRADEDITAVQDRKVVKTRDLA